MQDTEETGAEWALRLLEKRTEHDEKSLLEYTGAPASLGTVGMLAPILYNSIHNRPWHSNLVFTVALGVIGVAIGTGFERAVDYRNRKRDAIIIDYIKKHPDRIHKPRNMKYADIFQPWTPFR